MRKHIALALLFAAAFAGTLLAGCAGGPAAEVDGAPERLDAKEDGPQRPFDPNADYGVAIQNVQVDYADGAERRPLLLGLNGSTTSTPCVDNIVCYEAPDRSDWMEHQRFTGQDLLDGQRFEIRDPSVDERQTFGPTDGVLGAVNSAIQGTGTYRVKVKMHGLEITGVTFEARFRF